MTGDHPTVDSPEAQETFDDAFQRLFYRAFAVAYRILTQREEAEDVAMETLARALARWKALGPEPDGWVVRVAMNRSIDSWRRVHRHHVLDANRPPPSAGLEPGQGIELREAISRLPRRQRQAVALRYLLDHSEAETAAVMGCSVGSVKQHTSRGLAALRTVMKRENMNGPS